MSKSIILFYSFEGNTKRIAMYLAQELNIPYEEIKLVKDFSSKGFSKYLWGGSQVVMKKKPELESLKINLEQYDTVILGSPIWAGSYAPAIKTILEDGILKDKNIAYFYCHDGGPGNADTKIKEAVKINNKLISTYGLTKVKTNFESLKDGALEWAKKVIGI